MIVYFDKVNFFYCGNNFSVNPLTQIRDLYYQFSAQDGLTIKYAISEALGLEKLITRLNRFNNTII